jgi:DNA-binding transcriptional regulator YiaG
MIKRFRKSQPGFARYLNTSESTVEKWESGRAFSGRRNHLPMRKSQFQRSPRATSHFCPGLSH